MKKRLLSLLLAVCMVAALFSGLTVNASAGLIDDAVSKAAKSALDKYFDKELLDELDLKNLDVSAILSAAATTETSGDFGAEGDNLHWSVEDGVLTITGSGAMEDFDFTTGVLPPWWNLKNVVSINLALIKTTGIQRVEIADTVTDIGEFAFFALPELTAVQLPAGLTELPRYALAACNNLAFPALPETLTAIGDYAMAACDAFQTLALTDSVQTLGSHAFAGCDGLKRVTVPETVQALGSYAFASCDALTKATLPATVTAVPAGCFSNCESLLSVTCNGTVTAIGERAVYGCKLLTEAPIPATVTAIGDYAFSNCKALLRVTLPEGLQTLGTGAFSSCELLTSIALPDAITVVPEDCFSACGLTDVTLAPATTEIGAGAFSLCILLERIDLPGTLTAIGEQAFSGCSKLAELTLPAGLQTIGGSAFLGCEALTALDVPGSVTSIGERAFSGCTALTELSLRAGAETQTIGSSAFALCTALTDAYCYGDAPAVTAADETGASFVKRVILIHYPQDNDTWVVADGLWNGYNAEAWNLCLHDKDGCTLTKGETVAPTCTEQGYTVYTCDNCGEVLHRDVTDTVPHTPVDVVVPPTCTGMGYTESRCAVCGTLLGVVEGSGTAPAGHEYELTETITAPTCTEDGQGTYTCAVCGTTKTDVIPAAGHAPEAVVVAPTCTETGYTKHVCKNCGAEVGDRTDATAALGHAWDGGVTVRQPTSTSEGCVLYTCTRCGETRTEALPTTACTGGPSCPGYGFTDMPAPDWWSHKGLDYCLKNGIMNGMGNGTVNPTGTTTRAQLVTMLYRMAGEPAGQIIGGGYMEYSKLRSPFTDTPRDQYYFNAVMWAYYNGVVDGVGENRFDPDSPITREQLATIFLRYTNVYGGGAAGSASLSRFPDAGKVSSWALEAMQWAVANGIINGVAEDGVDYLRPQGDAKRDQVATIIMRYERNILQK